MVSLQDILKLSVGDGSKFFVMDEQGEIKLVIMRAEDYQKLLQTPVAPTKVDVEKINKKIIEAQLRDQQAPVHTTPLPTVKAPRVDLREEVIDPSFNFDDSDNKIF